MPQTSNYYYHPLNQYQKVQKIYKKYIYITKNIESYISKIMWLSLSCKMSHFYLINNLYHYNKCSSRAYENCWKHTKQENVFHNAVVKSFHSPVVNWNGRTNAT